mgnify:CR=1 FL=1
MKKKCFYKKAPPLIGTCRPKGGAFLTLIPLIAYWEDIGPADVAGAVRDITRAKKSGKSLKNIGFLKIVIYFRDNVVKDVSNTQT